MTSFFSRTSFFARLFLLPSPYAWKIAKIRNYFRHVFRIRSLLVNAQKKQKAIFELRNLPKGGESNEGQNQRESWFRQLDRMIFLFTRLFNVYKHVQRFYGWIIIVSSHFYLQRKLFSPVCNEKLKAFSDFYDMFLRFCHYYWSHKELINWIIPNTSRKEVSQMKAKTNVKAGSVQWTGWFVVTISHPGFRWQKQRLCIKSKGEVMKVKTHVKAGPRDHGLSSS